MADDLDPPDPADLVAQLREELAALQEQLRQARAGAGDVATLKTEIAELRAQLAAAAQTPTPAPTPKAKTVDGFFEVDPE